MDDGDVVFVSVPGRSGGGNGDMRDAATTKDCRQQIIPQVGTTRQQISGDVARSTYDVVVRESEIESNPKTLGSIP